METSVVNIEPLVSAGELEERGFLRKSLRIDWPGKV